MASDQVALTVYHGRRSYEIGVEFNRPGQPGARACRVHDVLRARLGPGHTQQTYFQQASDQQKIIWCLDRLAALLADHCAGLLEGNEEIWARVENEIAQYEETQTRIIVEEPLRAQAATAWDKKDYRRVVALYGSLEPHHLSEIERRRLEYGLKRVREGR